MGPAAGIAVLLADLTKGFGCGLGGMIAGGVHVGELCALAAVVGQIAPVFSGFRGGKGAATTLGAYVALAPALAVIGLASWGLGLLVLRRAVVSTVTAIVALALVSVVLGEPVLLGIGGAIITLVAHRNDLMAWRRGELPTIRESLRDNRRA